MNEIQTSSAPQAPRPGHAGIEQRLLRAWQQRQADPGSMVLLAFSGGPDSFALAVALRRIAPLADFRLAALHVDHRLRASSAAEAASAMALAGAINLDCRLETLSSNPTVAHPGAGIEEAARRERYAALARHAHEFGAAYVVTAHHQEDQAETVLLHLLRGAGMAGAAGMAPVTVLSVPWWPGGNGAQRDISVWRPWLAESRDEIAAYRRRVAPDWQPVLDPSNGDNTLLRNRLRSQLMPLIEDLRPGAAAAVARFGQLAAMDDHLLSILGMEAAQRLDRTDFGIALDGLRALPEPLLRRVVRLEVQHGFALLGPSADRIGAVVDAIRAGRGNVTIQVGEGVRARLQDGRLRLIREENN